MEFKTVPGRLRSSGFCFPVRVMPEDAAATYAQRCLEVAGGRDESTGLWQGPKVHLRHRWADSLIRLPSILKVARSVLGPDILVWSTAIFVRMPGEPGFAWHQDSLSYDLAHEQAQAFRLWIALTPATPENGTMCFIPQSHRVGKVSHTRSDDSLVAGDRAALPVATAPEVPVRLAAGEASLHDLLMIHSSGTNHSDVPRVNFAIDFFSPAVRPLGRSPDSALLVSGVDDFRHFERETSIRELDGRAAENQFDLAVARRLKRFSAADARNLTDGLIHL